MHILHRFYTNIAYICFLSLSIWFVSYMSCYSVIVYTLFAICINYIKYSKCIIFTHFCKTHIFKIHNITYISPIIYIKLNHKTFWETRVFKYNICMKKSITQSSYDKANLIFLHKLFKALADSTIKIFIPLFILKNTMFSFCSVIICFYCFLCLEILQNILLKQNLPVF